jgi:putative endonuclease
MVMARNPGKQVSEKRVKSEFVGRRAETIAAWLLRAKGYRILARRCRCPAGEMDIIAKRGTTLVFVEVKARRAHASALFSITPRQVRRIVNGAKMWLAGSGQSIDTNCRFDIIAVSAYLVPKHMINAFGEDFKTG